MFPGMRRRVTHFRDIHNIGNSSPPIERGRKAVDVLFDLKRFISPLKESSNLQTNIGMSLHCSSFIPLQDIFFSMAPVVFTITGVPGTPVCECIAGDPPRCYQSTS